LICLYLYQYLLLWDVLYIVGNKLMSTSQRKFNHANPFSRSWDISRQSFYNYWCPDISVICCLFCTSLLWLIPQGYCMDKGQGYDNKWSAAPKQSQSVPHIVGATFWSDLHVPHEFSSCSWTHVYLIVTCFTSIYSVDTLLYPYALPLQSISYTFSSLCPSATWALA